MSLEELKLIISAITTLGEYSVDAFIVYIVASEVVGPIAWLITCMLFLIYVPKGIAKVAYNKEEQALLEIRSILRPNWSGCLTDDEIRELIKIIKLQLK